MTFLEILADYSALTIMSLALLAFVAGFIDSVVGGGGLIQIPALLVFFPNAQVPTLFGTNKIAALSGTSVAAFQYAKRIKFDFRLLAVLSFCSFLASYFGAKTVSYINAATLKPMVLFILVAIVVYTFLKKYLGSFQTRQLPNRRWMVYGAMAGLGIGFYDSFLGPGTGSFFVLAFVVILGFEFVQASAYAKVVNCMTNISALIVFIRQGNYMVEIAILMAVFNISESVIGSKMAIKRGNGFIRIFFLLIVSAMIVKYGIDVFYAYWR
jgi:hypothetical protein